MNWRLWLVRRGRPTVYLDFRDWWIGYYRSEVNHYVCPLPTVVVRWRRKAYREVRDV